MQWLTVCGAGSPTEACCGSKAGMQQAEGAEEAHDVKACSAAAAGTAWKRLWTKLTTVLLFGAEVAATAGVSILSSDVLQFHRQRCSLS